MVFILATAIGKVIHDEVKVICNEVKDICEDYHAKKKDHRRSSSTISRNFPAGSQGKPLINKSLPPIPSEMSANAFIPVTPIELPSESLIERVDARSPPATPIELSSERLIERVDARSPAEIPRRSPLRVKVGNDIVPWSPNDIVTPSEAAGEDLRERNISQEIYELE